MIRATIEVKGLGGGSWIEEAEARINPPKKPHRLATDYQVKYRGGWFRVEHGPSGAMYLAHAGGRMTVTIKPDAK